MGSHDSLGPSHLQKSNWMWPSTWFTLTRSVRMSCMTRRRKILSSHPCVTWWEPDRCRPTSVNIITMGRCSAAGCRQPHRKPHCGDRNRSVCFVLSRFRSLRSQSNRFVKFLGNFSKHVLTTKIVFVRKNDVDLTLQQSRYVEYWRS